MTAHEFRSVYDRVVPIVENNGIEVTISDVSCG